MNHTAFAFRPLAHLTRPFLSTGVASVTAAVYVYYHHAADTGMFGAAAGVFLLSCVASAINQYQERDMDARMERTRERPFATGAPWTKYVPALSACGAIAALLLLYAQSRVAAIVGIVAVVVYNGIYTTMKRHTPFALFPGAVAGALPALIGCAAATDGIDGNAVVIAIFAFMWQVPHFLLLSIRFTDDYRSAGFPTLATYVPVSRLRIITVLWMLAACCAAVLFPAAGVLGSVPLFIILIAATILVAATVIARTTRPSGEIPGRLLHAYQGVVMALLAAQGLVRG